MKVKLNFSGAAIAGFFANNGEKLVLGVMVLVLLLFLYGAITAKPLDESKSPDAIATKSKEATNEINKVKWEDAPPEEKEKARPINFKKLIDEDRKEVPLAKLQENNEWNSPLFPELTKRGDPDIYPVGELQIASGYALVAYVRPDTAGHAAPAAGGKIPQGAALPGVRANGSDVRPVYYNIVTGVVPVEKEELEYKRRFEYAMKPGEHSGTGAGAQSSQIDVPQYLFFNFQRAEVTGANDPNPKWVQLDWHALLPDGGSADNKLNATYTEFVEPEYLFKPQSVPNSTTNIYLTWPLPPVVLKYWGLEAAHPKVRLVKLEGAAEQQAEPAEGQAPAGPLDIPGAMPMPGQGAGGGSRKPASGAATAPKAGAGPGARPGGPIRSEMGGMAGTGTVTGTVPYRLFRFIDLTAEKGKMYRYRVQLILANPNLNLKPEELEKAESAKPRYVLSPWSDPSATVTVPQEARILAEGVTVARAGNEPLGKIRILTMLKDEKSGDWLEVMKDFDLPLGGYAAYDKVKIENVTDMEADDVRTITVPAINANQTMLLDVRNDEVLGGGKSKGPTEMLLIDSTGRITSVNSAADSLVVKDYQQRTTVTPEAAPTAAHPAGPPRDQ